MNKSDLRKMSFDTLDVILSLSEEIGKLSKIKNKLHEICSEIDIAISIIEEEEEKDG